MLPPSHVVQLGSVATVALDVSGCCQGIYRKREAEQDSSPYVANGIRKIQNELVLQIDCQLEFVA
jgi:hypothetical protein